MTIRAKNKLEDGRHFELYTICKGQHPLYLASSMWRELYSCLLFCFSFAQSFDTFMHNIVHFSDKGKGKLEIFRLKNKSHSHKCHCISYGLCYIKKNPIHCKVQTIQKSEWYKYWHFHVFWNSGALPKCLIIAFLSHHDKKWRASPLFFDSWQCLL